MSTVLLWSLLPVGILLTAITAFLLYIHLRYTAIVGRVFEEKPLFLPLRVTPTTDGEDVRFSTRDGLTLAGVYFKTTAARRLGVIVFSHEYLGDRWSALAYVGHLRALGFDLFSFDYRSHGKSDSEPSYKPLQWVTNHELHDLRGALTYLRSRPDHDPAGVGLFGVSRGGATALCVGGKDPSVWGVATDGAFPTQGTMIAYIMRWATIYVDSRTIWAKMPRCIFEFLGWAARKRSQVRLKCRFPNVERATARLAPRPLFMIHGEKDAYIGPKIAETLFDLAGEPKEMWLVPKAKHNRCREAAGQEYFDRITAFFLKSAPRITAKSALSGMSSGIDLEASAPTNPNYTSSPVAIHAVTVADNALSH